MRYITAMLFAIMAMTNVSFAADEAIEKPMDLLVISEDTRDWSGFYGALAIGYGWGDADLEHLNVNQFGGPGGKYTNDDSDFLYGGAVGYNYQFSGTPFVLGAEAGLRSGTTMSDHGEWAIYNNWTNTKVEYVVSAVARVGYDLGDFMPYVKAGYAGGKVSTSQLLNPPAGPMQTWTADDFHHGYTLGAGVDVMMTENIFVGLDYSFTDLGKVTLSALDNRGNITSISNRVNEHAVMARVGFRF